MKAIRVHKFGDSKEMKYEVDVPRPQPAEDHILIKVKAIGVNPVDAYVRSGGFGPQPFPYIPGMDFAGTVEQIGGKALTDVKKGDRVYGSTIYSTNDAYAEYVAVKDSFVLPLSDALSYSQGAAIPVPYFTAYRALFHTAHAVPGETVFIHGASGGVGVAAAQLARGAGLRVIGTAGTSSGAELVKKAGAEQVFNHREEGYIDKVKAALGEGGADIVIENVANKNLKTAVDLAGNGGRVAVIGGLGEVPVNTLPLLLKEVTIFGVLFFKMTSKQLHEAQCAIQAGIDAGWLRPHIWCEMPLEKAAEAQNLLSNGNGAKGKVVLIP